MSGLDPRIALLIIIQEAAEKSLPKSFLKDGDGVINFKQFQAFLGAIDKKMQEEEV